MIELLQKFSTIRYEEIEGYYVIYVPPSYDMTVLDYALVLYNGGAILGGLIAFEELDDEALFYLVMQGSIWETPIRHSSIWAQLKDNLHFRAYSHYPA